MALSRPFALTSLRLLALTVGWGLGEWGWVGVELHFLLSLFFSYSSYYLSNMNYSSEVLKHKYTLEVLSTA